MKQTSTSVDAAAKILVRYFERNGYFRRPDLKRRKKESRTYKMGYEVRLVAHTKSELSELRRAIRATGLKAGSPFRKVNRWLQPIYGRESMDQFVEWLKQFGQVRNKKSKRPMRSTPRRQTSGQ